VFFLISSLLGDSSGPILPRRLNEGMTVMPHEGLDVQDRLRQDRIKNIVAYEPTGLCPQDLESGGGAGRTQRMQGRLLRGEIPTRRTPTEVSATRPRPFEIGCGGMPHNPRQLACESCRLHRRGYRRRANALRVRSRCGLSGSARDREKSRGQYSQSGLRRSAWPSLLQVLE